MLNPGISWAKSRVIWIVLLIKGRFALKITNSRFYFSPSPCTIEESLQPDFVHVIWQFIRKSQGPHPFLFPLKTSENLCFYVFRNYRKRSSSRNIFRSIIRLQDQAFAEEKFCHKSLGVWEQICWGEYFYLFKINNRDTRKSMWCM